MTIEFVPTPEHAEIEKKFLECVQQHPGLTPIGIARKTHIPVKLVRQACAYLFGTGELTYSLGRVYPTEELAAAANRKFFGATRLPQQDEFFVTAPVTDPVSTPATARKLPDLTPPTEAGLDGWEDFYGLLKKDYDLPLDQFAALPIKTQNAIQEVVQASEIMLWRDSQHAKGYEINQENYKALGTWLNERRAPITQRNLTRAYQAQQKTRKQMAQEYLDQLERDHKEWRNQKDE